MTALWPTGAAYLDGAYMPIGEAKIPVTEFHVGKVEHPITVEIPFGTACHSLCN